MKQKIFTHLTLFGFLVIGFFMSYLAVSAQGTCSGSNCADGNVQITTPSDFTTGTVTITVSGSGGLSDTITLNLDSATTPVNGQCGTTKDSCLSGNFSDTPDDSTFYKWDCTGINGGVTANCSVNKDALAAPSNLTATAQCSGTTPQIALSWTDNSSNEDGFRIFRDGIEILTILIPNTITHIDTPVTTGASYIYKVSARNLSSESSFSNTASATGLNCASPNLTASNPIPNVAVVNTPLTFSSTITNIGGVSTGSSFSNFFQTATATNGGGTLTDLVSSSMTTLAASESDTATSPSVTFFSVGTYSVRACADKTNRNSAGSIPESDENNNCSPWTNITVSNTPPPPSTAGGWSVQPDSITLYAEQGQVPNPSGQFSVYPTTINTCYNLTVVASDDKTPGDWLSISPFPTNICNNTALIVTGSSSESIGRHDGIVTFSDGNSANNKTIPVTLIITDGPNFYLEPNGSFQTVKGTYGSYNFEVKPTVNFTGDVNLSVNNCPMGATCSFLPHNPITSSDYNSPLTLKIDTPSNMPLDNYPLTITGANATASPIPQHSINVNFTVTDFTVSINPSDPDLPDYPLRQTVQRGSAGIFDVSITSLFGVLNLTAQLAQNPCSTRGINCDLINFSTLIRDISPGYPGTALIVANVSNSADLGLANFQAMATGYGASRYSDIAQLNVIEQAPVIQLIPPSFNFSLAYPVTGNSDPQTLKIHNNGLATLNWELMNTGGGGMVQMRDFPNRYCYVQPISQGTVGPGADEQPLTIIVYPSGGVAGATYHCDIVISDPNATNNPQTAIVNITIVSPVTLTATPPTIYSGNSSILHWESPSGWSCAGTNFTPTGGAATGDVSVGPTSTTIYTVTCNGASASATVTVKKRPTFIEN
ncbi:hypothetical protein A3B85_03115 [Candidatus Nomurabacteria bacterium RIFCSPHIGHO2_02_FULL_37_13]|uniref:Fibronectin type-III domain-containing protein n=1 Tax=Candidatus Nomurabacteria bacterium RIFCSPHIGHO2_02_FULL_37_13 TaxID=1801750 RepID=A0A1F6W7A7_9BACT|nr:MAG: hypothetical protein A2640_00810 [Candidatus Nomurabacteria bacterium RIFCSPHIGHO2_01_FULL_36_23]OGI77724.1 MAG: hypothetical protein A3B85_03115 [Candidatus Nomurabacteria bacterium RIFCSPHIGHO2_02_FULL_37_13]OGI87843.1 MAG: hypothetical protein A2906_02315 [Candidatus Nomurabacteria bacterium RIFCSPLOWO2_01_FULL_37_25]